MGRKLGFGNLGWMTRPDKGQLGIPIYKPGTGGNALAMSIRKGKGK